MFFADADKYFACVEEHQDGQLHIHVYLYYFRIIRCDESYFDVVSEDGAIRFHPNIRVVGQTRVDHNRTLRYIAKSGYVFGTLREHDFLSKNDVYSHAVFRGSLIKAQELVVSHATRDYFVSHSNVTAALRSFFPLPPSPQYVSPYAGFTYLKPLYDWNLRRKLPGRFNTLVLYGRSGTGKTSWARSLGRHNYIKGEVTLEGYDHNAEYNVIDDLSPKRLKEWDMKSWLGGDDFMMGGKYRRPQKVKWIPVIYICNRLPLVKQLWDFDWWITNTTRIHVDRNLY